MTDWLRACAETFLHLNEHLTEMVGQYGPWVYAVMFAVIFAETGLVVMPFLPGDSLLFAAGAVAAGGSLNPWLIILFMGVAATLGNLSNYSIGRLVGPRVFRSQKSVVFNPKHLGQAHRFYEKYGAKTIVLARFMPLIRTFGPFAAGIARMDFARFTAYSILACLLWVTGFTLAGFWFGNLPAVKRDFHYVILVIVIISILPAVVSYLLKRRQKPAG